MPQEGNDMYEYVCMCPCFSYRIMWGVFVWCLDSLCVRISDGISMGVHYQMLSGYALGVMKSVGLSFGCCTGSWFEHVGEDVHFQFSGEWCGGMVWAHQRDGNLFFPSSGFYCTKVYRCGIFHQLGGLILLGWENSVWIHIELRRSSVDANPVWGYHFYKEVSVFFTDCAGLLFFSSFSFWFKAFAFSEAWASWPMAWGLWECGTWEESGGTTRGSLLMKCVIQHAHGIKKIACHLADLWQQGSSIWIKDNLGEKLHEDWDFRPAGLGF